MKAADVEKALAAFASPSRVLDVQRFFKTAPGEYGEGDIFIGVRVPDTRKVAAQFLELPLDELQELASSEIHEHRHCALIILTKKFQRSRDEKYRKIFFDTWMTLLRAGYINNWDLVDVSAPFMGAWLVGRSDSLEFLTKLARSKKLWERRASIIFTFAFIRAGHYDETLEISEILVDDKHDLIQKAVGWMLREAGKRNVEVLRAFLKVHASTMPRTMLRYSIEKLSETERKRWMAMKATSN